MSFVPDQLLAEAVDTTGLDDFGDPGFREGLAALCGSLEHEARLSDFGRVAVRQNIVGTLATRLRVTEHAKVHREALAAERIEAPLIVVGLFRAGTTFLSYLLDNDPGNRALLRWETGDPVPPPTPDTFREGPRVEAARAAAAMMDTINPRFKAIHHEEADGPTECVATMAQDFASLSWESIANIPSYSEWLYGWDHRSTYAYHEQVLRILQSGGVRGRWTLKSPHHAISLDALVAQYPDARLVVLHRDPLVLAASVCSLIGTLAGTFTEADHRAYVASHWTDALAEAIRRIDAFRDARPDVPLLDVQYADLVGDPVATVERIATFTGAPLAGDARRRVARYVETHPKGRFGAHRYDLAELGLDAGALEERFAGYVERHDVARERPAS